MKKEVARRAREAFKNGTAFKAIKPAGTRNRKTWTDTDNMKLTRMYRSGKLTLTQIANRLGRTYFAATKQASRLHLTYGKKLIKLDGWAF